MQLSADTLQIPPHNAAGNDFYFPPHLRAAVVDWAHQHLADFAHHSDRDLIRACRVLVANSPDDYERARELLAVLKVPQYANRSVPK